MLLRPLYLMMLGLSLLLTACQGGTRVIKDGFTARPANKSGTSRRLSYCSSA